MNQILIISYYNISILFIKKKFIDIMNTTNVLKNQKANKIKKFHMKSILNEVKNKSIIEDLQYEKKFNDVKIIKKWTKRKQQQQTTTLQKDSGEGIQKISIQQQKDDQQSLNNLQNALVDQIVNKKKLKLNRRSSKLQFQLDEIVKYSQMYPSRHDSQKQISQNIQKLSRNRSQESKTSRFHKSTFLSQFQDQLKNKQNQFKIKRKTNNQGVKNNKKWQSFDNKDKQNNRSQKKSVCNKSIIDENLMLNLIDNSLIQQEEQPSRKQYTNYLIKRSKEVVKKNKIPFGYSFSHFMQNQLNTLRQKAGRKTEYPYVWRAQKEEQNGDIRQQNLYDIHQFLRGQCRQQDEFGKQITVKEIKKFQQKYDLYSKIYKKTKQCLRTQKFDLHKLNQLTVKNAIYLNETLAQCNTHEKKRQVQKIMRRLNFYN